MITINEFGQILGVSDLTVRRYIKEGKLAAQKLDNRSYIIKDYDALEFIDNNPKHLTAKKGLLRLFINKAGIELKEEKPSDNVEEMHKEILKKIIGTFGIEFIDVFNNYLDKRSDLELMSTSLREIQNKLDVTRQPTIEGMINILKTVLAVDEDSHIRAGQIVSGNYIEEIFGRNPQQEGINFCTSTKELFVITKLGVNNPTVEYAEYNDYWKNGKIYYEGKGQSVQEMKGSNLHLERKYQVFHNLIKPKEGVPAYIHVFNKVKNRESEKFQYMGKFYVTDRMVDEHSAAQNKGTKTAIIFELTPIVGKTSQIIDENYIL